MFDVSHNMRLTSRAMPYAISLTCFQICLLILMPGADASFPDIGLGARPMGMGGAFVALADDANSIFWNPAGLSQLQWAELSSMYLDLYGLENVGSHLIIGALRHPLDGGIGFGWLRTGETGLYTEDSLIAAVGQGFPFLGTHLSIGGSLKVLNQSYQGVDRSDPLFRSGTDVSRLSYDVGILWRSWHNLSLGGMIENLGSANASLFDGDDDNQVPPVIRVGIALRQLALPQMGRVTIALEGVQRKPNASFIQRSLHAGAEWQSRMILTDLVPLTAMVRTGARWANRQGNAVYVGGGLQFGKSDRFTVQIDYAFSIPITEIGASPGNTHRVSFSLVLPRPPEYPNQIAEWKRQLCIDSSQSNIRKKVAEAYKQWLDAGIRDSKKRREMQRVQYAWIRLQDGITSYKSQAFNDARRHLEKAIELDLELAEAYKFLSLVYAQFGQREQAQKAYQDALNLEPETELPDDTPESIRQLLTGSPH